MDEELMEQVIRGSNEAFRQLVLRHQMRLQHIAYRFLGKKEDAEDVTQEIFLRLYLRRNSYVQQGVFASYLTRITINECIDRIRRRTKLNFCTLDDNISPPLTFPEKVFEKQELSDTLQKALDELPTRQRMAFLLKIYTNLSYKDIGHSLDCSRVAVEGLIFRARQTLQKKLHPILKEE